MVFGLHRVSADVAAIGVVACAFVLAYIAASAIRVADQWNKAVVLRLGKFRSLEGPGLFMIIPIVESIPYWIDTRVLTSSFKAEKTLTKDTVPVDVDAVLFWKILDPKKAALDVADYQSAINWAAQTALRDVIGKNRIRSGTCVGSECGVSYGLSQWASRHRCIRMSHQRQGCDPVAP